MLKVIKRNKKQRWIDSKYSEPHKARVRHKDFKKLLMEAAALFLEHTLKEKPFFPVIMGVLNK